MAALETELLTQRYSPQASDAEVNARLLRSHLSLTSASDQDTIGLIAFFRASIPPLPSDHAKQKWLSSLIGILSQARRSNLLITQIRAVFQFLGGEVYPFLRKVNNDGNGGPTALPADQAVLLVHSLKDHLTVQQIDTLLDNLLIKFPKRPECKTAIEKLRALALTLPNICQIVNLLKNIKNMDHISDALINQLSPYTGTVDLSRICSCLGITLTLTKEARYRACLEQAMTANIPRDLDTNMVCVMWDAQLRQYITGFNATKNSYEKGHIPQGIWNNIPERIDPDFYKFGRGCAEVHCISQAFKARVKDGNTKIDLKGCVFAAYHPKERRERPACAGCNQWLTPTKAFFNDSM